MRNIKNYIIPVLLSILILGVVGIYAGVTISNSPSSYLQADNLTINSSGAYVFDGSTQRGVSSGTADVVICRGTSVYDDYYKSIKWISGCDVVCKSSDNDCHNIMENTLNSINGSVYFAQGDYPINNTVTVLSGYDRNGNVVINGAGMTKTRFKFFNQSLAIGFNFSNDGGFAYTYPITISNIQFYGDQGNTSFLNIEGVAKVSNCEFFYSKGTAITGTPYYGSSFTDIFIHKMGGGYNISNANAVDIERNLIDGASQWYATNGIYAVDSPSLKIKDSIIQLLNSTSGSAIILNSSNDVSIENIWFEITGSGIVCQGSGCSDLIVNNPRFDTMDSNIQFNLINSLRVKVYDYYTTTGNNFNITLDTNSNIKLYNPKSTYVLKSNNIANVSVYTGDNIVSNSPKDALYIDQEGNGNALNILGKGTNKPTATIECSTTNNVCTAINANSLTSGQAFQVYSSSAGSSDMVLFFKDSASSAGSVLRLINSGTGVPLLIDANTTAKTCAEGGIYYDGTTHKHYGCNGTGWQQFY